MIAQLAMLGGGMALKGIGRAIANQKLKELEKNMPKYKENALATTLLNARMPGAAQAERNILAEQANMLGKSQQAATSSSDIMQQIGGLQSQTNQALQGLAGAEAADYQRRYGNYVNEKDKVFADELRQYQTKAQLQGARQENMQNTFGDIANLGMGLANFEAAGGFKGTSLQDLVGKKTPTVDNTVAQPQTLPLSTMGTFPGQGSMNLTPYGRMDLPPVNRVPGQMGMNLTPYERMQLPPMNYDYYNQGLNNFFPYNTMRR